jgi:hypothetical protein
MNDCGCKNDICGTCDTAKRNVTEWGPLWGICPECKAKRDGTLATKS